MRLLGAQPLIEALDFFGMLLNKPWIEQRKILPLPLQRQLKETRDDRASASRATTAARPDLSAVTVDDVVVGDLIASSDCSASNQASDAVDRSHVCGRIARGVDVSFGSLHQHNAPAFEIVAVMRELTGDQRMIGIYDASVIDLQDRLAYAVASRGKDT